MCLLTGFAGTGLCGEYLLSTFRHGPTGVGMGRSSVQNTTVAVFGCTGYLGKYVVNKLGQHGFKVIAPFRCDEYKAWPLRQMGDLGNINLRRFSLAEPDTINRAMEGSDVVVNLIAQDRQSWKHSIQEANIEAVRLIAEACNRQHATLLHTSHLAANSNSQSAFLKSKFEGQQMAQNTASSSIIIRPARLFGLEDSFVNTLGSMSWLPWGLPVMEQGKSAVKWPVFVGDVAEAILQIILHRHQFKNQIFDLYGYHYIVNQIDQTDSHGWN